MNKEDMTLNDLMKSGVPLTEDNIRAWIMSIINDCCPTRVKCDACQRLMRLFNINGDTND